MKPISTESENLSFWQTVFAQSKVNGGVYIGEQLQGRNWNWPKDTYFQRRLQELRYYQTAYRSEFN